MTNLSTLRNALQAFDYNHMTPYAVGFDRTFDRLFDYVTHETHAARAPPARVPLADDASWIDISASQPEPPDAARAILLERLVEKAEVAIETNDGAFQEEVIHGVWEMAVNAKDVIGDFPRDAFRRVVALVEEGSADARWMACAAVWCLSVSAVGRAALLDVGGEGRFQ